MTLSWHLRGKGKEKEGKEEEKQEKKEKVMEEFRFVI